MNNKTKSKSKTKTSKKTSQKKSKSTTKPSNNSEIKPVEPKKEITQINKSKKFTVNNLKNNITSFFTPERNKTIKKTLKISIISLIIITILFFTFNTSIELNFLLNGDVTVSTNPSQINILTEKRYPQNISIDITTKNQIFCKAECSYEFKDFSENVILDQHNFTTKGKQVINFNQTIIPPPKGTGQLAYELIVECQNVDTFLCKTRAQKKITTTFVSLGFELSQSEREFVSVLKDNLTYFLENLYIEDNNLQYFRQKYDILQPQLHENNFEDALIISLTDSNNMIERSNIMRDSWNEEEYIELSNYFPSQIDTLNDLKNRNIMLNETLNTNINKYQTTVSTIRHLNNELYKIENISYLRFILNYYDYKNKENEYILSFLKIINKFRNNDITYNEIINDSMNLNQTIINDTQSLENELIEIILQGRDLLNQEQNKYINNVTSINSSNSTNINSTTNTNTSTNNNSINTSNEIILNSTNTIFIVMKDLCDEIKSLSNTSIETKTFKDEYCLYRKPKFTNLSVFNFTVYDLPHIQNITIIPRVNTTIKNHEPICCILGECDVCCENEECYNNPKNYPVIFIHGHAFSRDSDIEYSIEGFNKIRRALVGDGFIDGGNIFPTQVNNDNENGLLGRFGKPVIFGTTYYINVYDENGTIIRFPSKNESIETYAQRLKQTIDIAKKKTNSEKVNIIAHSMGGLVSREYIREFGEEDVNNLIMIGTPNKGVSGKIETLCPITGSRTECLEMAENSEFMNRLNNINNKPNKVKLFAIYGLGCNMDGLDGDGVVLGKNAKLPYSLNFQVNGVCGVLTLHEEIRDIDKYPQVYETITNILRG